MYSQDRKTDKRLVSACLVTNIKYQRPTAAAYLICSCLDISETIGIYQLKIIIIQMATNRLLYIIYNIHIIYMSLTDSEEKQKKIHRTNSSTAQISPAKNATTSPACRLSHREGTLSVPWISWLRTSVALVPALQISNT